MKKTALLVGLAVLLFPAVSFAQVEARAGVELSLNVPVVLPPLVVVSPGVQVVSDVDEEIFLVSGFYWVRHDGGWYRSRSHRGGWVLMGPRYVPASLVKIPPGKYKRWKPAGGPAPAAYGAHGGKHEGKKHGKGKH